MITIRRAAQDGHTRLRMPHWSNPLDHIEITIHDGMPGPWAKLWSPFNPVCNGRDPMMIMIGTSLSARRCIDPGRQSWVVYDGPLPDSAEYRQNVESFERFRNFIEKGEPYDRSAAE